jgi:hypothetical protein
MEFCKFSTMFTAITAVDRAFLPNSFEISVTFTVNEPNPIQQNVAFQRIKHFIENELNFAIIATKNTPGLKNFFKLQNKVLTIPNDGLDWGLACTLCLKLNAICEGRFTVNLVELNSSIGDHVTYYADWDRKEILESVVADMPAQDDWWTSPDIAYNRHQKFNIWKDLELEWQLTKDHKSSKVEKIIQFKPKVVKGGRTRQ